MTSFNKLATRLSAVALIAIVALTACSKNSDTSSQGSTSTGAATVAASGAPMSDAGKVYQTNCSSCHQVNGQGVPGTFPPLAGNDVVNGDANKVIHIVKFGLTGKIEVGTTSYNGMMPAWGQQLSAEDIAKAITYIRSSWGNKGSAVTAADVTAAK